VIDPPLLTRITLRLEIQALGWAFTDRKENRVAIDTLR
jgi:hypothetical protein